jgi:hypothetical protein
MNKKVDITALKHAIQAQNAEIHAENKNVLGEKEALSFSLTPDDEVQVVSIKAGVVYRFTSPFTYYITRDKTTGLTKYQAAGNAYYIYNRSNNPLSFEEYKKWLKYLSSHNVIDPLLYAGYRTQGSRIMLDITSSTDLTPVIAA